jgi:hypothetical protein
MMERQVYYLGQVIVGDGQQLDIVFFNLLRNDLLIRLYKRQFPEIYLDGDLP